MLRMELIWTFQQMNIGAGDVRGHLFLDVKVWNPHAPSNHFSSDKTIYRRHELKKERSYKACACKVKHGSFTPLIFSATGSMAEEADTFYEYLASMVLSSWINGISSMLQ